MPDRGRRSDAPAGGRVTGRDWLMLVLLQLALAFAFGGTRGVWEPAEGWTARQAERLIAGQPLEAGGGPAARLAVPVAALGLRLFGHHEFGLRFGSGLLTLAMTLVVGGAAALVWRRSDRVFRAALYFALSPVVFHRAALAAEPGTPLLGWPALSPEWLMPAGLVASAALAVALAGMGRGGRPGRRVWGVALAWSVVLLAARLVLATLPSDRDARFLALTLPNLPDATIVNLDDREHPGLGWYERRELVNAAWEDSSGAPPPAGRLALGVVIDRMAARTTPPHLFLIAGPDVPRLTTRLTAAGLTVVDRRAVGRLGALLVYRVNAAE